MIKEFLKSKYVDKLDRIECWEEKYHLNKETVSMHSFKVAAYTAILLEDIFPDMYNDIKYNALKYAVFHDLDEAIILRDISHQLKYNTFNGEEIRNAIDRYVEHVVENSPLLQNCMSHTPMSKAIVKIADWIALYEYCNRELEAIDVDDFSERRDYCYQMMSKHCYKVLSEEFSKYPEVYDRAKNTINELLYK